MKRRATPKRVNPLVDRIKSVLRLKPAPQESAGT
jgi:hypothetical protein